MEKPDLLIKMFEQHLVNPRTNRYAARIKPGHKAELTAMVQMMGLNAGAFITRPNPRFASHYFSIKALKKFLKDAQTLDLLLITLVSKR